MVDTRGSARRRRPRLIELAPWPELKEPVMIAAFEGWNDAGEAASSVVNHLARQWDAEPFAALDPEEYYDFQVNRPTVGRDKMGTRRVTWPTTRLLRARIESSGRDVLLVDGIEPSIRWRSYVIELLESADRLGVTGLVTIGALLADVPHTRPIPVSCTSEHPTMLAQQGIERSTYEGPTGIVGVLADAAHQAQLPAVSMWAAVPHYAGASPSPKAMVALLRRLEDLLGTAMPLADLVDQSYAWERGVDELADGDVEVAEYVRALEQAKDTTELPEASGEAIAKEFEQYLRRRNGDSPSP
ncbi:MAG: PAC2 family protein [Actinomycetota bacterium]